VFNLREPDVRLVSVPCDDMRILVTNDDGVDSPGIKALAAVLTAHGHTVTVFAPTTDRSGAGAGIGKLYGETPPPVTRADWPDLPDVAVHALDAPPATAVLAACMGAFGERPELVASGINPGQNTGHLVLHSGTVGAALTAAGLDVPGLAVSLGYSVDGDYHWDTAATFAAAAVAWTARDDDGRPRVLNVNVPNVAIEDVRGVREATLATHGEVWIASADVSAGDLKIEFQGPGEAAPGTDVALVRQGDVAVTPLVGISRPVSAGAAPGAADAIELDRAWTRIFPEQAAARRGQSGEPSVSPVDTLDPEADTRRSAMT
jgi:5'-nucleotidase